MRGLLRGYAVHWSLVVRKMQLSVTSQEEELAPLSADWTLCPGRSLKKKQERIFEWFEIHR
jgi:hypothetical protein